MAKQNETTTEMVSLRLESRMKEGIDMLAKSLSFGVVEINGQAGWFVVNGNHFVFYRF